MAKVSMGLYARSGKILGKEEHARQPSRLLEEEWDDDERRASDAGHEQGDTAEKIDSTGHS